MSVIALDMPIEHVERLKWLEKQLIGLELADLAGQLAAVNGAGDSALTLDAILGDKKAAVLAEGLGCLDAAEVRQLLTTPRLLVDLQEFVCEQGAAHWSRIELITGMRQAVNRVRRRLDDREVAPPRSVIARIGPWMGWALAAAIAVAAVLNWPVSGGTEPWGWLRPGALASSSSTDRATYLNHLADGAQEWFQVRPGDRAALAARIGELRRGCTRLILSEHAALSATDRNWLIERCQLWAGKLDEQLAALEAGSDVNEVLPQADETVNTLVKALRDRAVSKGI